MTPLQMAIAECANWDQGSCCGFSMADSLNKLSGMVLTKCLLAANKRCHYFEGCVLPLANMMTDPAKSKAYLDVAADYRFQHHISGTVRRCPECGGQLSKRKRFCADCTTKHRKKTFREAQARLRDVAVNS